MPLVLDGTNGVSGVDGTASNPSLEGTDSNTGIFYPAADTWAVATGGTEALRVNSSQNVGIGTSSPVEKLTVAGGIAMTAAYSLPSGTSALTLGYDSGSNVANITSLTSGTAYRDLRLLANNTLFLQGGTERAHFNSAGAFKQQSGGASYEDTTLGYSEFNNGEAGTTALLQRCTNASFVGSVSAIKATRAASTAFDLIISQANAVTQFRVRGDGTIYAINTTVQSASDERMKENIRDSEDGLGVITALRPVRFDYKEGFGNGKKNQLGFIAQEIEQAFPYAVDVWGKSDDPDNPYKSVGAAALIPVFVKAIQELNAKVEAQAAEIAALKAQP